MGRWGLGVLGALALLVAAPAQAGKIAVGKAAPDFHATLLDNSKVSLADFRGQVVILNFWATWCGPCRVELPLLDRYVEIQGPHGLKALAVSTEDSVPVSRMKALAAAMHIPMVRNFRGPYGYPEGLPTNYVIDRSGVVRYAQAGAFDLNELNAVLVPLLAEPAPEPPPAPAPKEGARPAG